VGAKTAPKVVTAKPDPKPVTRPATKPATKPAGKPGKTDDLFDTRH
jgi:hypothetical protein